MTYFHSCIGGHFPSVTLEMPPFRLFNVVGSLWERLKPEVL